MRNGLPPELLHSIALVESGYRQDAVSPKGAVGIMQLMPQTAKELQADASDAEQNVNAGARYLRQLLLKYMDDPYQVRKALATIERAGHTGWVVGEIVARGDGPAVRYKGALWR